MPLHFFVFPLKSMRVLHAVLFVAALAVTVAPAHAQWDRDGYFNGDDERNEPRRTRRPDHRDHPGRDEERRSQPSDSYDFDVDRGRDKASGIADVSYFYEALDDGGVWMNHPRYGDVWQPYVDESWRPYTLGRWAYSDDYGWTWVSDEPFGWAVYHYGRWSYDADYGWLWVPGTEWAPAWVAWRQSEEAIGWAPLPPEARLRDGQTFDDTDFVHTERFNRTWVFVRPRYFARPEMRRYVRPPSWNNDLVQSTAPRNNFESRAKHGRNRGLAPDEVERLSNRPVPRIRVAPVDDPGVSRPDRIRGRFDNWRERSKGEVKIFRPERRRTEDAVRKFRKSQPGSGSDGARESGSNTAAPAPRPVRRSAKPVAPGTYPGGKPTVTAAPPPRFERGPVYSKPTNVNRDAAKTQPAPAAAPPADAPPSATSAPAQKSAAPAYVPSRTPASGAAEAATPVTPKIINPSSKPTTSLPSDPPRTTGKRRWDGSGPSGAPTVSPEGPAEN